MAQQQDDQSNSGQKEAKASIKLSLDDVYALSHRALIGAGAEPHQAAPAANSVQEAEADGIRTVGLAYLPFYCAHLKHGKINGAARPSHIRTAPAAMLSRADNGFAHAAWDECAVDFLRLSAEQGMAGLAMTESYSAGVVGWFVERIAAAGMIGLGFANSSAFMAPWGGRKPFFGTNPLAFAIPRADRPPLVADFATSQVAYVTVRAAAERGEKIPLGWVLDANGQPTADPNQIHEGGTMGPAGGYKGALLALLVDILAGGLGGPHFSHQASSFGGNEGGPPRVGEFFIAIRPGAFGDNDAPAGDFSARLEVLLEAMCAENGVRLPGDRRIHHRERATREGVDVPGELIGELESYASGG